MRPIGAAHIESVLGAIGADHAEIGQELLFLVQIGRPYAPISEIKGLDHRHDNLPKRTCRAILGYFADPSDSSIGGSRNRPAVKPHIQRPPPSPRYSRRSSSRGPPPP